MIVESTEYQIKHECPNIANAVLGAVPVHKFPYNWNLKDANFTKDKGKVFSCFACGGGSSFGYKLAGFDVIGHNDIDKKMIEVYKLNHNPKYSFLESITTFAKRKDLPKELYELDILDGSPPCSSFSMAGNREKDWGKEKVFREGQELQVLDTLFFDFIDLAKELQPKVVVAENVKGLLLGEAKEYVIKIYKEFDKAGYYVQHFLLDASKMGVPQRRERVFFIALRKDLAQPFLYYADMFTEVPKIELNFNEPEIKFSEIKQKNGPITKNNKLANSEKIRWDLREFGDSSLADCDFRLRGKNSFFNQCFIYNDKVLQTLTATKLGWNILFDEPRKCTDLEFCYGGSYPKDYNFINNEPGYLIGMSVPPIMTAQIASNIYEQWLSKL
jgi:DNA (cytosine-5)-methyltransferase 1